MIPGLKKGLLGLEATPALLGVGYILGFRISAILVAGGLLSWLGLIPAIAHFGDHLAVPLFPESEKLISQMSPGEIWTRYVRYIGAGAVAVVPEFDVDECALAFEIFGAELGSHFIPLARLQFALAYTKGEGADLVGLVVNLRDLFAVGRVGRIDYA